MKNGSYTLIIAPKEYPGKKYRNRYAYEHHIVWWKNTGETLRVGEVLHHRNGKKRDNRFINLERVTSTDHGKLHGAQRSAPVESVQCYYCNVKFFRQCRIIRSKKSQNQAKFFCCKSHVVKQQHKDGVLRRKPSVVP